MNDEMYMQRCLDLAAAGLREAMPNPSAGAVLVYEGRIIGEGYTSPYGGPHGEVNCINSVLKADRHLIPLSTLYVSLEPCSHYGKTPPCCDLIIKNGIQNIVIGTIDTFSLVSGNGIKKLQEAGCTVITGILEQQCRESNGRFFAFNEKKRPYIILKWAESADGFISPEVMFPILDKDTPANHEIDYDSTVNKKPIWITNRYSRQLVHKWRSEEMAILTGTQTVLEDNPQLDVRTWTGRNPVRVVLDRTGKITDKYFVKNQKIKTIVLTAQPNLVNLENLIYETVAFDSMLPHSIMEVLYRHAIQSVIVEGGRQTLQTFIDAGLWDEARVFTGTTVYLESGTKAPVLNAVPIATHKIGDDQLLTFRNYGNNDSV